MAIAIGGPMEQPGFKIARLGPMRPIGEEFWARLPSSQRAWYNVILAVRKGNADIPQTTQ